MDAPRFGAVLPCAGSGTRVGADRPKQFLELGGRPVFHWSLAAFLAHPRAARVVLVVSSAEFGELSTALAPDFGADFASGRLVLVAGGAERWESVRNGVVALPADIGLVAVHDVARPFVTDSVLDAVLAAAEASGGAVAALPCPDTVKWAREDGPVVESTLDRRRVWLTQTPQAFRREELETAYAGLPARPVFAPTDEASLVEAFGTAVALVPGSPLLRKITTADDLEWARWKAASLA